MWPFNIWVVSSAKYRKLQREYSDLECADISNRLRLQIAENDARIAMLRLRALEQYQPQPLFDDATLRKLISLCHPDRHDGKQMAQEMTSMLIEMRKASR